MGSASKESPGDDAEFLTRAEHRSAVLDAVARHPQTRADLRDIADVSQSTIGRTLRDFEERRWIKRDGKYYQATQLGAFVAEGFREFVERLNIEHKLRDVWEWLPDESTGFTIEMCADAVVTVSDAEAPYRPVNRLKSLLRDTEQFRFAGCDVAFLEPSKDELCQQIKDGMRTEMINPPRVARYMRTSHPELFSETLASGNLTVRLHDALPDFGVCLFDDRVAVSGYDPDSVMVRVLVDTDSPTAREWAESVYMTLRRETPTVPLDTAPE